MRAPASRSPGSAQRRAANLATSKRISHDGRAPVIVTLRD
jgi:hypothetical protein